jgi:hypothetical protein
MIDTPASFAIFFDEILSPIAVIACVPGPMNLMPFACSCSWKVLFSDRKPYPGWTACAPVFLITSMMFGIFR